MIKRSLILAAVLSVSISAYAQPARCIFTVQYDFANNTHSGICQNAINVSEEGVTELMNAWRTLQYAYIPRIGCGDQPGGHSCEHGGQVVACGLTQSELTDNGYVFTMEGIQGTITQQEDFGSGACDGLFAGD